MPWERADSAALGCGRTSFPSSYQALELLAEAGFTDVAVKQVAGDFLNNFFIAKKH
jgi:DNA-binding transcriptional regulator LsrR (DeoR family)